MAQTSAPAEARPREVEVPVTEPEGAIRLSLTLEEARMLRTVAQRGLIAAGADGGPEGQPHDAAAAIGKLSGALEEGETIALVRTALEQSGFDTRRLSDAQVSGLGRRLAEIPKRVAR